MKYHCSGFKSIDEANLSEYEGAIDVFARRLARREYGKRGEAVIVRENARSQDGRLVEYDVFIGTKDRCNRGWVGRNVFLSVTKS